MDVDAAWDDFLASVRSLTDAAENPGGDGERRAVQSEDRSIVRARAQFARARAEELRARMEQLRAEVARASAEVEVLRAARDLAGPLERATGILMFLFSMDHDAARRSLAWLARERGADLEEVAREVCGIAAAGGSIDDVFRPGRPPR